MTVIEELKEQIDVVDWPPLWRHFAFGRVRIVDGPELVEVGVAIVEDDADRVQTWKECGAVAEPSDEQVRRWSQGHARFEMVVVRPFVLIRELVN